jgi:4-hydroxybenzoate polyprenyltransferase
MIASIAGTDPSQRERSALGIQTGLFGLVLAGSILLFDAIHRVVTISPALLGFCRFWLYIAAASTAADGVTGWAIWGALALAVYVTGLAGFAVQGRRPDFPQSLPLFVPIGLAMVMNVNHYREAALLLSVVLGLWVIRSLRYTFWSSEPDELRTRSDLVAGIIFVDWVAVADAPKELSVALIGLFLVTLTFQRMARAAAP